MSSKRIFLILSLVCLIVGYPTSPNESTFDEKRLFQSIMSTYEKSVRPCRQVFEPVVVKLGISLTQILDIVCLKRFISSRYCRHKFFYLIQDERNQIMTTNIWLDQVTVLF